MKRDNKRENVKWHVTLRPNTLEERRRAEQKVRERAHEDAVDEILEMLGLL